MYFTTGKVATALEHPRAGKGQLQRDVKDMHMLAKVFDNPRVHSDAGYHKTEPTRKRHKENGMNPKQLTDIACRKYHCTVIPGPPQDRGKLVVFSHPTGFVIRVWFNAGTIGVREKNEKEVYIKNLTIKSVEKYLDTPRLSQIENRNPERSGADSDSRPSFSSYRYPLGDLHQQSSSTNNTADSQLDKLAMQCQQYIVEKRSLRSVDKDFVKNIADLHGFNLIKEQQLPPMLQYKSQNSGGPVLNFYYSKGTVSVQGKGMKNESMKNCTVEQFISLLMKHGNKTINDVTDNLEVEETPQAKALRLVRENAARQVLGAN